MNTNHFPVSHTMHEPLTFININSQPVEVPASTKKRAIKRIAPVSDEGFHKGWRVVGVPGDALKQAEQDHPRLIADAESWNLRVQQERGTGKAVPVSGPWDADKWLNEAKLRPVRSKPYELQSAANECAELARKAGWLRVSLQEVKKEASKPEAA